VLKATVTWWYGFNKIRQSLLVMVQQTRDEVAEQRAVARQRTAKSKYHALFLTRRPYSRFSRQEPLLFYQVAPQLYSRG
jgi:hypothetical protein